MRKTTEDFIGTCQACFGEYKVNEKSHQVVFHGYQRPGDGYTIGRCSGTDHAPFEYDTALTVLIIGQHRDAAERQAIRTADLQDGKITKLTRRWTDFDRQTFKDIKKSEEVEPGHKHWDSVLRDEIAKAAGLVSYHTDVGLYLNKMVREWTRGQIVGIDVPATGKERALRKAYDPAEVKAQKARDAEKAKREAKPGKLKVIFYTPEPPLEKCDSDAEWRARYDRHMAEKAAFLLAIKTWVKANVEGKTIVREASNFDLPTAIRRNGRFEVVSAHLPWEYRDRIEALLPGADRFEDDKKKVSFTFVGQPKTG